MKLVQESFCHYCGSTIHFRAGYPHCNGDNLLETAKQFDEILELALTDYDLFTVKLKHMRDMESSFDLFIHYWNRKKMSEKAHLTCIHKDEKHLSMKQREALHYQGPPMPLSYIPFPDLVEVYIAEIMLGRELTNLEKDGSRKIPKISESGQPYLASLTWTTYPHGYMSIKDMTVKTNYSDPPLPKIFDIENIRGMFKGRDGEVFDD